MTPEGKVKDLIKKHLAFIGLIPAGQAVLVTDKNTGWYYMPVSNGMGVHGIPDFIGHYRGRFFAIEAKEKGKKPTDRQVHQLNALGVTGAATFVVDSDESLEVFKEWARKVNLETQSS